MTLTTSPICEVIQTLTVTYGNQSKLTEYRPCTGEEDERWERKCQLSNDDDDDGDKALIA